MEEKRKWANAFCALCLLFLSLLTTGRTVLMQAICGWLCLSLLQKEDRTFLKSFKWLGAISIFIIIMMSAITLLTKAETQEENKLQVATNLTFQYIAGPIAAFDYAVYNQEVFKDQPAVVFEGVLVPLSKLGFINFTLSNLGDDFVEVPFPANVYTCFKPYYEDFGMTGCFLSFALFGLTEGYLFYRSVRNSRLAAFFWRILAWHLCLACLTIFIIYCQEI